MEEARPKKLVIHCNDTCIRSTMSHYISRLLEQQKNVASQNLIALCIGSDRYIGDALGPLVGSYLEENTEINVYGSLEKPVHAKNLVDVIAQIHREYYQPLIIAIDACLGKSDEIGNVEVWPGSLEAGVAVGASLPSIGHISIVGVVNASGYIGYLDLQNTPLSVVVKLSKCIGGALEDAVKGIPISKAVSL